MLRASAAAERAGYPSVTVVSTPFRRQAAVVAKGLGLPDMTIAEYPGVPMVDSMDDLRRKVAQSKNGYLDKAGQVKWQKKLYERGWVAPDWPVELGGAGFTPSQRYIFNMELSLAGTPNPSPMGLKMCAPVVMGTSAAKLPFAWTGTFTSPLLPPTMRTQAFATPPTPLTCTFDAAPMKASSP